MGIHQPVRSYMSLVKERNDLLSRAVKVQAEIDGIEAQVFDAQRQSMRQVVEAVAIANAVTAADLMGISRDQRIVQPRQEAFRLCRLQGLTLPQIGRFFGRDHTTILHGIRQAEKRAAAK